MVLPFDLADVVFNQAVEVLDQVVRLETPPNLLEGPDRWSVSASLKPSASERAADWLTF